MEVVPELLSRDDILRILNHRHLNTRNMNELTHEGLLRIYKNFVIPLSRRPEKQKRSIDMLNTYKNKSCYEREINFEHSKFIGGPMEIDTPILTNCKEGRFGVNDGTGSPIGEKRRQRNSDDEVDITESDYQYQLSSVTKRIRINSFT